jgi:hypothetical protein
VRLETRGPIDAGLRREDAVRGLVSVVIPAFNSAAWIDATIASVRAQTYHPIEIVVADDGSSDATRSIAASLGVRVVRSTATGPGGARNAGLETARGEFIQYLDADDLIAPGKIARQVALLESSGGDVAWEPFHHLVPARPPTSGFEIGRRVVPELGPDLAASLLSTRGFMQIGALLVRRSRRTDRVWFATGREVVEDVRYVMALAMAGARFVSSESAERGLLFRQHTGPRYSTRPTDSFARGCAAVAAWAEAEWERHGGLTSHRRDALGEAYAFAARQLAELDPAAFRAVAAKGLGHGESFLRHLPARVRWLSWLVGYTRAESIAASWRRARRRDATNQTVEAS